MKFVITLLFLLSSLLSSQCLADDTPKARLADTSRSKGYQYTVTVSPVALKGGSSLTLISPKRFSILNNQITALLQSTHKRYTKLLGKIPPITTSIRLMDEKDFFKNTGAPEWTNAIFYKDEITIPIPADLSSLDLDTLARTIRHEYTHAIINALSAGHCPGWLDEGLAQWAEGEENPILKQVLYEQLSTGEHVPFKKLQNGFTKLPPELVPAAYAQSLYITRDLIYQNGFPALQRFFKALRTGYSQDAAFIAGFNMNERLIEMLGVRRLMQRVNRQSQIHAVYSR